MEKKLCRPFQVVKNISFHPSFKPSVNEGKVSHQLLLNGKLVTNRKFRSDGKKSSEGLGFKKLSATEVLEATISSLKPWKGIWFRRNRYWSQIKHFERKPCCYTWKPMIEYHQEKLKHNKFQIWRQNLSLCDSEARAWTEPHS